MKSKKIFRIAASVLAMTMVIGITAYNTGCNKQTLDDTPASSEPFAAKKTWTVNSPDNGLEVKVELSEDGALWYSVKNGETQVVDRSDLNIITNKTKFEQGLKNVGESKLEDVSVEYDAKTGKKSHISTSYDELTVSFESEVASDMRLNLTFRAYNDGYAFRYGITASDNSSGKMTVISENTSFAIPDDSYCYYMPYTASDPQEHDYLFSYEGVYVDDKIGNITGDISAMPFLYRTGTDTWSLITESDLYGHDYIGTYLKIDRTGILRTIPAAGANAGAYDKSIDKNGEDAFAYQPFEVNYPFESPWRMGITGSLSDVVESTLVEDVYGSGNQYWKPDNYEELSAEEKEIYNYDWVEPGISIWSFIYNSDLNTQWNFDLQKRYIDYAEKMGYKYVLLCGGWQRDLDNTGGVEAQKIVDYATDKGIKILVWAHGINHFGTRELIEYYLDWFVDIGIAGVKPDYYDGHYITNGITEFGESQYTLDTYEILYQECAKRKLLVNCHGGNKPTGERREYPNVLNREAIRGQEFGNFDVVSSKQLVTIPYLRGVIGPSDFTPALEPFKLSTTMGMQLALYVLYESGVPTLSVHIDQNNGYANNIDKYPVIEDFMRDLPATWDEVKFLDGTPMEDVILGRRKGDDWWIGGGNAGTAKIMSFNCSFIEEGVEYKAEIFTDDGNGALKLEEKQVKKGDIISVDTLRDGGFVVRIRRADKSGNFDVNKSPADETVKNKLDDIIKTQPQIINKVYDGKAAALTVTVEEGQQATYQWYKKSDGQSSAVQGATSNTLNLKNVADSGLYYCTVSVGNDSINSATVSVSISKASITITAGSINKTSNTQLPLTCNSYEVTSGKLLEGHRISNIEMTADSALSEIGTKPNKINKDSIVIKDSEDNDVTSNYEITTADGVITIVQGATIATQPQNLSKTYNGGEETLSLTVSDAGDNNISYQWYKKDDAQAEAVAIQGATANTLKVVNVADSGMYYCTVTVGEDVLTSATATVSIGKAPITITADSGSQTSSVQTPLTVSTYKITAGSLVEGHKISALEMTTDSVLSEIGTKPNKINKSSVIIKDSDNNDVTSNYEITTADGVLTITQGTAISTQPQGVEKTYNGSIHTLSVTVAADSGKQISYQWYKKTDAQAEAVAVQGATANTLEVVNVADSGLYYCVISDGEKNLQTDTVSVAISKIAITLTADSGEQTTDTKTPLVVSTYKLTGTLADGHKISNELKMTSDSTLSEVGTRPNKIDKDTVKIVDGEGKDVTANYEITLADGTLTVKLGSFDLDGDGADETL